VGGLGIGEGAPEIVTGSRDGMLTLPILSYFLGEILWSILVLLQTFEPV